jgi:hypothetical protein
MSTTGRFGRIPEHTVTLMERTIGQLRNDVLAALPGSANQQVRAETLELILSIVLRDWHQHSNTTGLLPSDITDLKSFVSLAASLTGGDLNGHGKPIMLAVLRGLMEDWLANWNAPGDAGPPGPH